MKLPRYYRPTMILLGALSLGGCTGISIAPSCPNELQVGESAPVIANEINPGEIAKYLWEVVPPQVGRVTDATKPSTTFEALAEGDAVIRLTASDGLYQVISQCQTRVAGVAQPPDDNTNDNTTDNGNVNDNTADNTNDNADGGKGDNTNDNGGRPGGVRKRNPSVP